MRRRPLNVLIAMILSFVLLVPFQIDAKEPGRGEAPECQQQCLSKHEQTMAKLISDYGKTPNKIEFQDQVQRAVEAYLSCTENCREVLPVK